MPGQINYPELCGRLESRLHSLLITLDIYVLSQNTGLSEWQREAVEQSYNRSKELLETLKPTTTEILEEAAFARRWA